MKAIVYLETNAYGGLENHHVVNDMYMPDVCTPSHWVTGDWKHVGKFYPADIPGTSHIENNPPIVYSIYDIHVILWRYRETL